MRGGQEEGQAGGFGYYMEERGGKKGKKHRKHYKALGISFVFLLILFFWGYNVRLTDLTVVGNTRYTEDELIGRIFTSSQDFNTFYTLYRERFGASEDIPFVEKYDIKVTGLNSARITVYEKSVAGCIEYMGSYMYFDREGIIVESSGELEEGVPLVTGLRFQHIVMYEKLLVEEEGVFAEILALSQLLSQQGLFPERIDFDKKLNVTLSLGGIRAVLGDGRYLAEKVGELSDMYAELSGRSGTVYLDEYQPGALNPSYLFVPDGENVP